MYAFSLKLNQCNIDYFHFLDSKSNLIMEGIFTKLMYALPSYTINSIYIKFPIANPVSHIKNFIVFDPVKDKPLFNLFRKLEIDILNNYASIRNHAKKPNYSISNMFSYGRTKFFNPETVQIFLLKISGVWESETEYGITFKVVDASQIPM